MDNNDSISNLAVWVAQFQRYRCVVDGKDQFNGETLPTGTEEEILAWITARYKVLGEVFVINRGCYGYSGIIHLMIDPSLWGEFGIQTSKPDIKRYLVEVDGVEKMFVFCPLPSELAILNPSRTLSWSGSDSTSNLEHDE